MIQKTFMFVYFIYFICCTSHVSKKEPIKISKLSLDDSIIAVDSTKLLDSIYHDKILLKEKLIDSITYTHTYDKESKNIQTVAQMNISSHKIGYILKLMDTSDIYAKDDFFPTDDFKYLESLVFFDRDSASLLNIKYVNEDSDVDPINVFYGKSFGPVAKYYDLTDREVVLLRGLNYYCNGRYCTDYKIIIVQKFKRSNKISINIIDYPGDSPLEFENTFLFHSIETRNPQIYLIKNYTKGSKVADFQIFQL